MITLDQLADNILGMMYPNTLTLEGSIPMRQVKMWIHYHRAKLIADNINKGNLNHNGIYQNILLNTRPLDDSDVEAYVKSWDNYEDGITASPPSFPTTGYLSNLAVWGDNKLVGDFNAFSSISLGGVASSYLSTDRVIDFKRQSQYGDIVAESPSGVRGDWRNIGYDNFKIPKLISLDKNIAVEQVSLARKIIHKEEISGNYNSQFMPVSLYHKSSTERKFGNYNKFTRNDKPYYTIWSDGDKYNKDNSMIKLGGLLVSPQYHGGVASWNDLETYFGYAGSTNALLSNPTDIQNYERLSDWSDKESAYPIPMEYVSDLVQRVVQQEFSTSLKTMASE